MGDFNSKAQTFLSELKPRRVFRGTTMEVKTTIDRRAFIKTAAAGAAGLAFLGKVGGQTPGAQPLKWLPREKFVYRTLGKTGLRLPVVSMGVEHADNPALIRTAMDAGVVHFDTAYIYQQGKNEELLGQLARERSRDALIISTKVLGGEKTSYENFLWRFNRSLQRLEMEYVDILYLHGAMSRDHALREPILRALRKLKEEGKTRFVGVSAHTRVPDVIHAAVDSQFYDVVMAAYTFKQRYHKKVEEAINRADEAGLGVITMKVFSGVFLNRENTAMVDSKAALKWVLRNPNVHSVMVGMYTFDQLATNLSVMADLTLTEEEEGKLKEQGAEVGLYCQGCEQCLPQCPPGLPIPDLMRAYMYVYGHHQLRSAYDLVTSLKLTDAVCTDCESCPVACVHGFNVAERIKDVIRLRTIPSDFIV